MAVCYFLGAKKITSKKSGKDFYPVTFLTINNWGDWDCIHKFCCESAFLSAVNDCPVGYPVVVTLDMLGNVLNIVPRDDIPPLELTEEGGVI